MPSTLDLTIAIPTLNCLPTLRFTLESLRELRDGGARVVVVDSDSSDGTAEQARQFGAEVINVPKGNMYVAVNAGLRTAQSEWLTYINGDDLLYADAVTKALEQARADADLIYGSVDYIDYRGRFLHAFKSAPEGDVLALAACFFIPVPQAGTLFRQRVFSKLGGFDTTFRQSADFDFFLRAQLGGFSFWRLLRPPIAAFRVHAAQYSQHFQSLQLAEGKMALERSKLRVPGRTRARARLTFRARNWRNYIIRLLRNHELSGSLRVARCLGLQPQGPGTTLTSSGR